MKKRKKFKILAISDYIPYFITKKPAYGEVTELVEGARLLSEWRLQTAPGFESLPLRHFFLLKLNF